MPSQLGFNPYHKWLGIGPEELPAHHYRLLGLALFETDAEVIASAADRQMAHLRTFQAGKFAALSQHILNEMAAARVCLLHPQRKAEYDDMLRKRLAADQRIAPPRLPPRSTPPGPVALDPASASPVSRLPGLVPPRPKTSPAGSALAAALLAVPRFLWQLRRKSISTPSLIGLAGCLTGIVLVLTLQRVKHDDDDNISDQPFDSEPEDPATPPVKPTMTLHEAVEAGNLEQVEANLYWGTNANAKGSSAMTPLHCAAVDGQAEIARLLIANGARVNSEDGFGLTPLDHAIRHGRLAVARLLIERGAEVNARNGDGIAPLQQAIEYSQPAIAKLLLAKGADVNARNQTGRTPLHAAALACETTLAELLLARGADIDARDHQGGATPLHFAARNGCLAVAKLLLDQGADPKASDFEGHTPLSEATAAGHESLAALLRESGAETVPMPQE